MNVSDVMTKSVVTIKEDSTVEQAAKLMVENNFSVLPVVDANEKLVGIITESDFIGKQKQVPHALASIKSLFGVDFYFKDIEELYEESRSKKLSSVMSKNIKSITSSATLSDLSDLMGKNNLKRVPVVDDGNLVGIVTRKDVIKAYTK